MVDGITLAKEEGTPQGGSLSPLLANILLDDLDRGLTRRGHRLLRYADDCNIYVRSRQAGMRVMASVQRFLQGTLKLKLNESKSRVDKTPSMRLEAVEARANSYTGDSRTRLRRLEGVPAGE